MISISENLRNHGYSSPQNAHTRIPGIWEKLGTLYNLEMLDARVSLLRLRYERRQLMAFRKTLSANQSRLMAILSSSPFVRSHYLKMNIGM